MRTRHKTSLRVLIVCAGLLTAAAFWPGSSPSHGRASLPSSTAKLDPMLRRILGAVSYVEDQGAMTEGPFLSQLLGVRATGTIPGVNLAQRALILHARFDSKDWRVSLSGVRQIARAGDVGLFATSPTAVEALASSPGVDAIELALPMSFKNDIATVETGALSSRGLHDVSGAGVILGFIGSGVDVTHPDLQTEAEDSRILYLLDLSYPGDVDGDGLLDGPDQFGGTLYTKTQIDSALAGYLTITGEDKRGHETHVIGTAAGNGTGTGNGFAPGTFAGVAPEAGIIVVKSSLADVGFVGPGEASAGLAFIDSIAGILGRPYVVNMSFGTHLSAHDGTSLEERFIDKTIGRGVPGKVVVVSAGNEGANYEAGPFIHCAQTLVQGEKETCKIIIPQYTQSPGTYNDGMILDMWYGGGDAMTVTVSSPSGETVTAQKGETRTMGGSDGSLYIDNAPFTDPLNLDNECLIQIDDGGGATPASGEWTIEVSAEAVTEDGRFDIWLAFTAGLADGITFTEDSPITDEGLVSSPGNSIEAITVGSYVNRESWLDIDNNTVFFDTFDQPPAGAIAPRSSSGPTRDGRVKPELAAPGRAVISTLSEDAFPGVSSVSIFDGCPHNAPRCLVAGDGRHAVARGTSFAAAHVAGAAALLLEEKPELDAETLKALLALTARPQVQTGGPWGHGKLDLAAAFEAIFSATMFEFYEAAHTPDGVIVSWRMSQGQVIETLHLQKAASILGPYQTAHSTTQTEGTYLDTQAGPDTTPYYRFVAVLPGGAESAGIPFAPIHVPGAVTLRLLPLFPNPAGATTTIRFVSSVPGAATLRSFDAAGRLVGKRQVFVPRAGVTTEILWPWMGEDGEKLPSGIYSITVEISGARKAAKVVVLR